MLRAKAHLSDEGSLDRRSLRKVALATAAAIPVLFGLTAVLGIVSAPSKKSLDPDTTGSTAQAALVIDGRLLDPSPMLGRDAAKRFSTAPVASGLTPARTLAPAAPTLPKVEPAAMGRTSLPLPPAPDAPRMSQAIPLPVPRPAEFTPGATAATVARAVRPTQRRTRAASQAASQPDDRSWFEKLFGLNSPTAPSVSYAALDAKPIDVEPRPKLAPSPLPAPTADNLTAVYDITAQTVTLPNGERLEAHSGLGDKMDDPRFVSLRMRGATPPGTYDLTEREAPFHGVRALRLNPIGGSATIHGRTGLLTHTYLLGARGDSNGCVSFREYDRFLQAYLRGEVTRLVVVSGRGIDRLPVTAGRRMDRADRFDRSARG